MEALASKEPRFNDLSLAFLKIEFITFYQNAFNQSALRYFLPECIAPRTTQIKTLGSSVGESVHRLLPRLTVFRSL